MKRKEVVMSGNAPANSNEVVDDVAIPFMLDAFGIHGRCVGLSDIVDTILNRHHYPERVAQLLGELLILTTIVGSLLKLKGTLTVQIQGNGALKFLTADYTGGGVIRGYAHIQDEEAARQFKRSRRKEQNIAKMLGEGVVVITIEEPNVKPYQAIVPLEDSSLTECILAYFKQSNQMNCVIESVCEQVDGKWRARGVMVQKLAEEGGKKVDISHQKTPEEKQEEWDTTKTMLASVTDEELLDGALTPHSLLFRLFHEYGIRVFDPIQITHACRCSRQKMELAALSLPADELTSLAEDGEISLRCHFCNEEERFLLENLLQKKNQ